MTNKYAMGIDTERRYEGVLSVLKPPGLTSSDVVTDLRRIFEIKRIGHAGTLVREPRESLLDLPLDVLPACSITLWTRKKSI